MRVDRLGFALICSSLALSCGSDETRGTQDGGGGSPGNGGNGGSTGGNGGSTGGNGGSTGGNGGSTGGNGGSSGSSGSAGSGGSVGGDDGGSGDSGIDAGEVHCVGMPAVFPEFDRACWDDTWCAIGFHQTDCCGNRIALGMLHPEVERFAAAEQICQSQYPRCGCPAGPAKTDTGQTATDDSMIKVQCRAGACTTYVP